MVVDTTTATAPMPELGATPSTKELFLGDGDPEISLRGFTSFCRSAVELISRTGQLPRDCEAGGCPHGGPEREAGKQAFTDLMRGNMWIVSGLCYLYVLFVFIAPRCVSKPKPVNWVLVLWNLALAIFSAIGSYHCMGALLGNVRLLPATHTLNLAYRCLWLQC